MFNRQVHSENCQNLFRIQMIFYPQLRAHFGSSKLKSLYIYQLVMNILTPLGKLSDEYCLAHNYLSKSGSRA